MSRNFYILAAALLVLSAICCGLMFLHSPVQPGLTGNGTLWETTALFLFLGAVIVAFAGVMTAMFEQVARRSQARTKQESTRRQTRHQP